MNASTKAVLVQCDGASLTAYRRARDDGAVHAVAVNIAVSVWFCHCPWVDGPATWVDSTAVRKRVVALLGEESGGRM